MHEAMKNNNEIVILGGGITGLSAAWELQCDGNPVRYTLIEKADRWGGKIETIRLPGSNGREFISDAGPESFITRKPDVWDLAVELELEDSVLDPGSETRNMYVLDGGKPVEIPLQPAKFLRSSLLSPRGKLRMLAEPFIPAKRDNEDKSLASFVTRRLGAEALEKIIGPVLAGIYNTDPKTQSVLTTSPIMREMENEFGGLFRGAFGRARINRKHKAALIAEGKTVPPRFMTFMSGAEELVLRLVSRLEGDMKLQTEVVSIQGVAGSEPGREGGFRIRLRSGDVIPAAAIVFATPANATADLIKPISPKAAGLLQQIPHHNIGTISLVFREEEISFRKPVNGLMIPRREARRIDAVTWTSNKMPERSIPGFALLRVFFGGSDPEMVNLEDAELLSAVLDELKALLGIAASPVKFGISRWPGSFPQAAVGHLDLVDEIETALPDGLYVAGSSFRGIGVPDCIASGRAAAPRRGYGFEVCPVNCFPKLA